VQTAYSTNNYYKTFAAGKQKGALAKAQPLPIAPAVEPRPGRWNRE